jgi:hypothetical protein
MIKLKLPAVVTTRLRDKDIIGMANAFIPMMAISAVYEEPPPSPTDEYANASRKNSADSMWGDTFTESIVHTMLNFLKICHKPSLSHFGRFYQEFSFS